jgi:hypothetical protein
MTSTPEDDDGRQGAEEEPAPDRDELFGLEGRDRRLAVDWIGEHLPEMRRAAFGDRLLYQSIGFCLVVGLLAYAGGYLLRSPDTSEPVGLLADLLYTLGYALWTGAVVVALLEVVPRVKQRQFREALQAYEREQGEEGVGGDPDARDPDPGPATGTR